VTVVTELLPDTFERGEADPGYVEPGEAVEPSLASVMADGRSVADPILLRRLARYVAVITGGLLALVAALGTALVVTDSENTAAWAFVGGLVTLIATCVGIIGGSLTTRTTAGALRDANTAG
jgi:hypothetical protein